MNESDHAAGRLPSWDRQELLALITIIMFAAILRLIGLAAGRRMDERLTYQLFVSQPWTTALSDYSLVNNHIFHTVLAKIAVAAFGPWLWALRLPAFIAGVLVVPATFFAVRSLYGTRAALIAGALVATCSDLVVYSASARGYSLVTLAFVVLLILAERVQRERSESGMVAWTVYALVAALALWTIPTALYPVGGVSIWLGLSLFTRRAYRELRTFALAMMGAGALTVVLYAPALARSGVGALMDNRFVSPSPWPVFLAELSQSAQPTLWYWYRGLPSIVAVMLAGCAVLALIRHDRVFQGSTRVSLPYVVLLWSAALLAVNHRAPQARMWEWVVPLCAGLVGAGVVHLIDLSPRASALVAHRFPALVAAFTAIAAVSLLGVGLF